MRKALIVLACASGMLITAAPASAINCKLAMKNLGVEGTPTRRSHQDVADTMGVGVDEIKKCEAEAKEEAAKKDATGNAQDAGGAAPAAQAAPAGAPPK